MNRLERDWEQIDHMMRQEDPRPSLTEWAMNNPNLWLDYITDNDPKVMAKALMSREDWRDFWTLISEKIEAAYEETTGPAEPDTDRRNEARAINAETLRLQQAMP